jgi:hypothetical protein
MARYSSSQMRSAINEYNSATRQHNANVRRALGDYNRAVGRYNAEVRELRRQLNGLRMTVTVRTSVQIRREVRMAVTYSEKAVLVRQDEWHSLDLVGQRELHEDAAQNDLEIIVIDTEGEEVSRY